MDVTIQLKVNSESKTVQTDPDRRLLDVLREDLGLTGTNLVAVKASAAPAPILVPNGPPLAN